jgi:NADH-quinone oxidoreductase subunit K
VLGLLGVGLYGLMACRNLIKIVVALQILVKAALLGLVAAGSVSQQINLGQSLAITVLVADTVVAVIGMALAVQIRRQLGSMDVKDLSSLRG